MKTLQTILISTLLLSISAIAMTSKVKEKNKTVYRILEGSTINQISKPGLAVDLTYKSEHVEIGETSDINITLYTGITLGTLKVNLKALDDGLNSMEEQDLEFDLSKNEKTFPIGLEVSSSEDGIHYINVTLFVEGQGSRVLVVPVNVGKITEKINNKAVETTTEGVIISVSSAEEEIK